MVLQATWWLGCKLGWEHFWRSSRFSYCSPRSRAWTVTCDLNFFFKSKSLEGSGLRRGYCYAPCRSNTDSRWLTRLRSNLVGPPSATLGTPGTALHILSQDTGDPLTSLSFPLYLLIFPMPRSDYLPRVLLMFSLIYFRSSSGSSINSSTTVGSIQTKNLVVFQFHLRANPLYFPLRLHQQLPSFRSSDSAVYYCLTTFASETIGHCWLPSEPIGNLRSLSEITAQGHRKRVT